MYIYIYTRLDPWPRPQTDFVKVCKSPAFRHVVVLVSVSVSDSEEVSNELRRWPLVTSWTPKRPTGSSRHGHLSGCPAG